MKNHAEDFEQAIQQDITIEPKDWMPEAYRMCSYTT